MKSLSEEEKEQCVSACPFCNNIPNVFEIPGGWVIECKDMGCIFGRSKPTPNLVDLLRDWNRRYGLDLPQAVLPCGTSARMVKV